MRTRLIETLLREDDVGQALAQHADALCRSLGAEALIISNRGTLTCHGEVSDTLAAAIIESLKPHGKEPLWRGHRREWPEAMQDKLGKWVSALGVHFDPENDAGLVALRAEQIETVRWGRRPQQETRYRPVGYPPALANALFDPFTRAAASIALNRSGMGLGLYIAKQIVAGHRRRIAYHHDGSQVVFVVNIPLRLGDPASPAR